MALTMIKKVKAVHRLDGILVICHETIYDRQIQFEIQNDDVKKHKDIKKIFFVECFMMKLPAADCLYEIAPNFDNLELCGTNLSGIASEHLRGFKKLKFLYLGQNGIEELPSDLFIHTPNLQVISFASNKIKIVGKNILEPLKNLKFFDLRGNSDINACFDQLFGGNFGSLTLAQFKEAISRCKPAQNVWNIVKEQENFKKKFETQEKEIINLKKLCVDQGTKIEGFEKKLKGQKKANEDIKKHCDALEKKLEEAKQAGTFSKFDFTIEINGKTFKVHKKILAANSPLLAELIRENEDADTLELKDISEEAFEEIMNFMVKKTQPKPTANFMEIYAASGLLQIKELNDFCAQTLMGKVTQENAVEILGLCKKYPNIELGKKALDEMKKIYEKP